MLMKILIGILLWVVCWVILMYVNHKARKKAKEVETDTLVWIMKGIENKTGSQIDEESMKEWYKNQDFTLEKEIHDEMFGTPEKWDEDPREMKK